MRTFFKWATATLCLNALAACGGNVVVDNPNGGSTTTITTSSGATGTGATTSGCGAGSCGCGAGSCGASGAGASTGAGAFGGGGDVSSTSSSSGTTTGCSCDGWLAGNPVVCGGAPLTAKMDLQACACGGTPCLTSCASNLCANESIADSCTMCLLENCASQLTNCEQN